VIGALGAAALACAVAAIRAKPARTFGVLIAVSIVVFIVAECVILPVFFAAQPNAAIAEIARRERMREPHLRVAAHQDPVGLSRELLFDARLDLAPLSDLRAPELGAPFLLIVGPDQAGIEVLSAYDAIPGYRKVGEYPYIPPGIFSVRGALHGVEPKTLELLSNFSD
jgi:hypothetical protein